MSDQFNKPPDKQEYVNISVGVATPGDWEALRDIRIDAVTVNPEAFGMTLEEASKKTAEDWQNYLSSEGKFFVLAKTDTSPTGAKSITGAYILKDEEGTWRVISVYTRPEFRGKGLAEKVLKKVLDEIRKRGGSKAMLNISDMPEQEAARSMYKKFGFKERPPTQAEKHFNLEFEKDLSDEKDAR